MVYTGLLIKEQGQQLCFYILAFHHLVRGVPLSWPWLEGRQPTPGLVSILYKNQLVESVCFATELTQLLALGCIASGFEQLAAVYEFELPALFFIFSF